MQLVITVRDGATAKDVAAALRMQAGLFEGMTGKQAASRANTDVSEEVDEAQADDTSEDDDDDFTTKKTATKGKTATKQAKSFEDDDENEETEEAPPVKKTATKAKKTTIDDVNKACKAYAKENGRAATEALLKKKFKSQSISEIDEDQWPAVIKAMAV